MARSRRSRRATARTPERGTHRAASIAVRRYNVTPRIVLSPIEDRRRHHPLGYYRPARQVSGHPVRPLVIGGRSHASSAGRPAARKAATRSLSISPTVRFAVPKRTIICMRRKTRREVLMAQGKGGARSGRGRKSRNWFTEVKCR